MYTQYENAEELLWDVLVIGAGNAGLCAAITAVEAGLHALSEALQLCLRCCAVPDHETEGGTIRSQRALGFTAARPAACSAWPRGYA